MRNAEARICFAAVLAILAVGCSPQMSTCVADSGVEAGQKVAIEAAAKRFVQALAAGDTKKAGDQLSDEIRPNAAEPIQRLSKTMTAASDVNWKVDGLYYIEAVAGKTAVCVDRAGENELDTVAIKPRVKQAHIFLVDGGPIEGMVSLWMIQEKDEWKVHGLSTHLSRIAGRDARRFLADAELQLARGDRMLGAILLEAARSTADRGEHFAPALRARIDARAAELGAPSELTDLSQPWRLGGKDYPVTGFRIGVVGMVDSDLSLELALASPVWKGDADAGRRARAFIDAFVAAHPAWDSAFDAILVRTAKPGGYYGTVYRKGIGYIEP